MIFALRKMTIIPGIEKDGSAIKDDITNLVFTRR
jgi:hypothetical protein